MGLKVKEILSRQKTFIKKIGRAQSAILLIVFYYTIFGIVASLRRCVKRDLLNVKWSNKNSYWLERERIDLDIKRFKRQF